MSRSHARAGLLAVVVAVLAGHAAAASAATVSFQTRPGPCDAMCSKGGTEDVIPSTRVLTIDAAPGEANVVTLRSDQVGYVVTDTGASPTAGPGCTVADASSVRCTVAPDPSYVVGSPLSLATITLGDGDDHFTDSVGFDDTIDAGPGDDVITTSGGTDTIDGGPGRDEIDAGDNSDTMLDSDATGDLLDGGPGTDTVSYAKRTRGVTVDMTGTGPDVLSDVEDLIGTGYADRLTGSAGPNTIDGGAGDDRIAGGQGGDSLVGGSGRDVLSGGSGADTILTADGSSDEVRCGTGGDHVIDFETFVDDDDLYGTEEQITVGPDADDVLARDCERTVVGGKITDTDATPGLPVDVVPRSLHGRLLTLHRPCVRCSGTVTVSERGRRLGRATFRGGSSSVALRLTRAPRSRLTIRYRVSAAHAGGWTVRL